MLMRRNKKPAAVLAGAWRFLPWNIAGERVGEPPGVGSSPPPSSSPSSSSYPSSSLSSLRPPLLLPPPAPPPSPLSPFLFSFLLLLLLSQVIVKRWVLSACFLYFIHHADIHFIAVAVVKVTLCHIGAHGHKITPIYFFGAG